MHSDQSVEGVAINPPFFAPLSDGHLGTSGSAALVPISPRCVR